MKKFPLYILIVSLWSCATLPSRYVSLNDRSSLSINEVLNEVEEERAIFVGEIHNTASSHRVQFEIIRHLHERGQNIVVALEMFPWNRQDVLNSWVDGSLQPSDFQRAYKDVWNIPFRHYRRIFEYARKEQIPLIGINAERSAILSVSKKGAHIISQDSLIKLKYTDCTSDPEYSALMGFSGERNYHTTGLPFLCDGQRLRDAVMAYNVAAILENHDHTVVVLMGAAHALKVAVPRMLRNHMDVHYKVLMPEEFLSLLKNTPDQSMADYIWFD
jgi:uncharacterized iron-regulated protein